jgi:cytochrome c peroxidase
MRHDRILSHTQTSLAFLCSILFLIGAVACSGDENSPPSTPLTSTGTPGAEESVGERLFLETRFAQAFKVSLDNGGDLNDPNIGDHVVDTVQTLGEPIDPGPFKGLSMNCRACHLVDDVLDAPGGGMRAYTDLARRSPIPARADGKTVAVRNSPPLVNSALNRPSGVLFHSDAEFSSMEELVAATFIGRNFGWLPGERAQAVAHIARVVRSDDGTGDLAKEFDGTPFRVLFGGTDASIPEEFRLTSDFRVALDSATDQEAFDAVVKVVAAYVNGLLFSQTEDSGAPIRSPFDVFLETNNFPQSPDSNESPIDYSRRLLQLVKARESAGTLRFVTSNPNRTDGQFQFHTQPFSFGAQELAGLKMFLAEPASTPASTAELAAGQIGNCIACHAAPNFTDFKAHNTGTTQKEYDEISGHGNGAFANLAIPSLATRTADNLPATEQHPGASERFRAIPAVGTNLTDLGLWNVFANPDMPEPQDKIRNILCDDEQPCSVSQSDLLNRAIARFKTPGLRDLGHSNPFMHTGQFDTLDDVLEFYREMSDLAREGRLRNGADQLRQIALRESDVPPLVAFLKSLNEDYQ